MSVALISKSINKFLVDLSVFPFLLHHKKTADLTGSYSCVSIYVVGLRLLFIFYRGKSLQLECPHVTPAIMALRVEGVCYGVELASSLWHEAPVGSLLFLSVAGSDTSL